MKWNTYNKYAKKGIIGVLLVSQMVTMPLTAFAQEVATPAADLQEGLTFDTPATNSAEVTLPEGLQDLPIVDPFLKPILEEKEAANIDSDIPHTKDVVQLKKEIRFRGVSKKSYLSTEEAVAVIENAGSENFQISVKNVHGKKIDFSIREIVHNDTRIFKVLAPSKLQPGKYEIEVVSAAGEHFTQDFMWGVLAINMNKSSYIPQEKVDFAMAVLDEYGAMVCDANVKLEIRNLKLEIKEVLSTDNKKIQVNPECSVKDKTVKPDYEASYLAGEQGEYTITVTAHTKNGEYSVQDSFSVAENQPYVVERQSATRIFPVKPYEMDISIIANQDFTGTISEVVPQSFKIISQSDTSQAKRIEGSTMIAENKEEVLGASVMKLRKPFDGEHPVSLEFGEQLEDANLKQTYAHYGLDGHDGIDFDMPKGTPVLAVDDGTITLAENSDYGLTVVVQHAWGKSYYGHLSTITLPKNAKVTKGQRIGLSGNSGISTGYHLHFGIKLNSVEKDNGYMGKIDPAPFLGLGQHETSRDYAVTFLRWNVSLKKGESVNISYTYDAPDKSPDFYTTGPLSLHEEEHVVFQETREWQIAVDATTHMLLFWDPANTTPDGWSIVSTYDGRYIRGESVANALTTGGNGSHTPTLSGSVTVTNETSGRAGGGTNTAASFGHAHTATVSFTANNNFPTFRSMRLIQYDAGIPSTIPANAVAMFDSSPGMPGSGWTRVSAQDTRFIRAGTVVTTGGADTHSHIVTWGSLTASSGQVTTAANTNGQGSATSHTHTAPSSTTTDTQTQLPPYAHAVFASADSTMTIPAGMVAMFDGQPSDSYTIRSDSGGTYYQRFIRGNTAVNAETTGGTSTHTHSTATSGVSGAVSATARGTATTGTVAAGATHTHTLSANITANDDHTPQYVNMVIAEKIDAPELTQIHSRWRNDDGSESAATWRRNEDAAATAGIGAVRRLRVEISNEGTLSSGSTTYRLEYGLKSTTCGAISTWTAVTAAAPGGTDKFQMHDSSNLTDGNATTNVSGGLTDENTTFVAGQVKDTGNQTTGITLTTSQFTEIEYVIKPTSNATATEIYCFRLTNAGSTTNFIYAVYPEITVGDPNLDVKHYRWRNDDGGESTVTNQTVSLLPTGQGSNTAWTSTGCTENTAEWDCVNDFSTADDAQDGTTTHLATTTAGARSSFTLNDGQVPTGATVSQIQIIMLGAEVSSSGGDATVTAFYNIGSGNVDCSSALAFGGISYTTQTCTFSGLSLSSTDIDNMQIGILFGANDPTITKMYTTITYSRSGATWKQSEDTAHTGQSVSTNMRLRLSIANTGDIAASRNFRLEYAAKVGSSCGDDETFTTVPVTVATEHFEMVTSSYFTDGDATTTQLTATGLGTFSAGKMIEDPSNSSGSVTSTNGQYTEMEYVIQASTSASGVYCFRVTDAGTALDTYTVYPEITISAAGPTLEQTMRHGKWFSSGARQPFTF